VGTMIVATRSETVIQKYKIPIIIPNVIEISEEKLGERNI